MTEQKKRPGWKPGQSGNPKGRKPGTGKVAKLREAIEKDLPEIIRQLVEKAKGGDIRAASILLERVLPPVRAMEPAVEMDLTGDTLTQQAEAVLAAAAAGKLTPGQSAQMLTALSAVAGLKQTDELLRRMDALEKAHGAGQGDAPAPRRSVSDLLGGGDGSAHRSPPGGDGAVCQRCEGPRGAGSSLRVVRGSGLRGRAARHPRPGGSRNLHRS